ncbi:MAG: alpha/beta hydrolase, partial [Verrucomicrobiota bacterium]|nr:alpha/beta hydrolase [Verrucomicrobiota bacterium]
SSLMTHDRWTPRGVRRIPIRFGHSVRGNLFFKDGLTTPAPVVVWLHPLSHHSGYNEGYGVQGTTVYHRLAENGFAVIAYDQCGFGLRLIEGRDFYKNHPRWSKLGRMVMDAQAAVSFAVERRGTAKSATPEFDATRVFLLGYSTGALTAMYTGALDDRIAGVACFSGWNPLRNTGNSRATGGNRRLWELHALQPRLGLFDRMESEIPFDYDDVLGLVLPKPCLVFTPKRDRFADFNAVGEVIGRVRSAKPRIAKSSFAWLAPDDTNRFQADQHQEFINWTKTLE